MQLGCADALVRCAKADGWDIAQKSKLKMRALLSCICKSNPNTGLRYAWDTDKGRPGNIFPLKNVASCKQLAAFFEGFTQ
jgi:hypothetical protein